MGKVFSKTVLSFFWFMGASIMVPASFASTSYIPASIMTMTGGNALVYFDVEDDIFNAGTSVPSPRLSTVTKTFSGAFYLSGAGWVDLGALGYGVTLDCGAQSLDALTSPCVLMGTGYSEIIGEVLFKGDVFYNPGSGLLSGSASTFLGEYDMSGVMLPLLPAVFREGTGSSVSSNTNLSISGSHLYGNGPWTIGFTPLTTLERRDISPSSDFQIDLSLAATYDVEVTDPQGSRTLFEYEVTPGNPNFTLFPGPSFRSDFCIAYPLHSYCQDGAVQRPSQFQGIGDPKIANANDPYTITLKLRDTYGNEVKEGDISLIYEDRIRTFQVNPLEYLHFDDYCVRNIDNYCALITGGSLLSNDDGSPETGRIPLIGGITYTISSRAPSGVSDVLSLSGITYFDAMGGEHDIMQPSLKTPIVFTPWYSSSLSNGSIMVGEVTHFTPTLSNVTPAVLPDTILGIYHIDIGSNSLASYRNFLGDNITCTKYVGESGSDECNWVISPDTSVISLWGTAFSGVYTPYAGTPGPENVSYRSFVRYSQGGTTVIYPSGASSLGMASAGIQYLKILGQDATPYAGVAVDGSAASSQWNLIKKNIALSARGRTPSSGYSDVDYIVHTGSITINNGDFHGSTEKRVIVSIGGDITVSSNIQSGDTPTVLIALMDDTGSGGDIYINQNVHSLSTSLFAEKSVRSSGDNQLYIFGNVFSHNTLSTTKCPYYVTGVCDPTLYNLEELRADYVDLASKAGHTSSAPRAQEYPDIPVIIEYDGRLITDPPSILEK